MTTQIARYGGHEPSYASYPDRGCILHPSCLACPRAVCVDDLPGPQKSGPLWAAARERRAEILAMAEAGYTIEGVRTRLGLPYSLVRTILRGETGQQEVVS